MNVCLLSGWVSEGAGWAYRDAARPVLLFKLKVGDDCELKCRVEDSSLAKSWEGMLTPGRVVYVEAEAKSAPVIRHGVTVGETAVFAVHRAEFPNRSKEPAGQATIAALAAEGEGA